VDDAAAVAETNKLIGEIREIDPGKAAQLEGERTGMRQSQ